MRRPIGAAATLLVVITLGCGGGGGDGGGGVTPPPAAITLSLSAATISVTQGQSGTVTVSVNRANGFTGPVDVLVEGAPEGVTAACAPCKILSGSASGPLELVVGSATAPGNYPLTIRGRASGVVDHTVALALTVGVAGSYTLTVAPTSVSVVQGTSATSTVAIQRTGGFAGAVALTSTGAPSGMTVVATPATLTGTVTSASLSIGAATSTAPGSYTLTVHAAASGLTERTATIAVQVTSAASGTAVTLKFCNDDIPIWVAAQNDQGAWTQITGTSGTYSFVVGTRGAVASVAGYSSGYATTILYASAAELASMGQASVANCANPGSGSKNLNGTVANIATSQFVDIALGGASAVVDGSGSSRTFNLTGAPDGAADLIAIRQTVTETALTSDRLIIRRGLNLPNGGTIPILDFASTEAVAPATANATLTNLAGDSALVFSGLFTATKTMSTLSLASLATAQAPFSGLPAAQLASGDLQFVAALATPPGNVNDLREVETYFHATADQTLALGPALAAPTISTTSPTAPQRLRAQLTMQSEYAKSIEVEFWQNGGSSGPSPDVIVDVSAGYLSGSPSSWDVTIPDLSVAGYNPSWGLAAGTPVLWSVLASSFPTAFAAETYPPAEGQYRFALRSSPGSSAIRATPPRTSPLRLSPSRVPANRALARPQR